MAVIGRFRSDLSITRKTDGNFGKRFRGCLVFQSRVSTKTVVTKRNYFLPIFVYKQEPVWFVSSHDKLQTSMLVVLCYGFKNGCMVPACNE